MIEGAPVPINPSWAKAQRGRTERDTDERKHLAAQAKSKRKSTEDERRYSDVYDFDRDGFGCLPYELFSSKGPSNNLLDGPSLSTKLIFALKEGNVVLRHELEYAGV